MSLKKYNIAVVGATGAVGEAFLDVLANRQFPIDTIYAVASSRSADSTVMFSSQQLTVHDVDQFDFSQVDYAFFATDGAVSEVYAPRAAKHCIVIDNSSFFRMDPAVPLVIPEVNPEVLAAAPEKNIIANPNCSTIQMLVALNPIYEAVGISRIDVTTYQAVSGAGNPAISELATQTASLLNGQDVKVEAIPQQIAFNVVPHIGDFEENGFTTEEMKMVMETHKIWNDPAVLVNPTAVRVPVFYGHSEAVHIETRGSMSMDDVMNALRDANGVVCVELGEYPTPITHAASQDGVFVGRIRQSLAFENGFNLWVVADNVKKGAALNAVQIAELLIKREQYLH